MRQGCPLGLRASWVGSGPLSWWGRQIISFSLALHPFLTSLPLTTLYPEAPFKYLLNIQAKSMFRASGMSAKERYKSRAETKTMTSAKMIASKYVWQLLFTVAVVTVHEIQPHFCLHWGRWAYSDSLAVCQKLHSQLTFIVRICSTVGGRHLFGIMIAINLPGINHLLFCHSFCCPFSVFTFSLFPPPLFKSTTVNIYSSVMVPWFCVSGL